MTSKMSISIVNILLSAIYNAGFGLCYDKQDRRFKLYSREWNLKSTEKECNSFNNIMEACKKRRDEMTKQRRQS